MRDDYRVVLVRRGRFRRRAAGVASDVDRTLAYMGLPGEEEYFAHPSGGDVCTSVSLKPALWRVLAGDATAVARPSVYVDARLDLAHRRVLAAAATGDIDYALTQELLGLLSAALGQVAAGRTEATVQASGIERRSRRCGPGRHRRWPSGLRRAAPPRGAARRLAVPPEPRVLPRDGGVAHPLPQSGPRRPGARSPGGRGAQPWRARRGAGLRRPGAPVPDRARASGPHTGRAAASACATRARTPLTWSARPFGTASDIRR